jgi:hypothetical protein
MIAKRMVNYVPADPVVEAVGGLNSGVETALDRRGRRLVARRPAWLGAIAMGTLPLSYASRAAAILTAARDTLGLSPAD